MVSNRQFVLICSLGCQILSCKFVSFVQFVVLHRQFVSIRSLGCQILSCKFVSFVQFVVLHIICSTNHTQKKRGNLVTRPTHRSSGIAQTVETSNAEAHADMNKRKAKAHRILHIKWAFIVALSSTVCLELPDSYASRTKRQETPYLYVGSPALATALAGETPASERRQR